MSIPEQNHQSDAEETITKYFDDGSIRSRGVLRDGKREGEWLEYHPTGKLASRVNYQAGIKEGAAESFYRDGSPKARRTFKAGLEDGTRLIWYLDGTTWEEHFRAGIKDGVWIERKDGKIVSVRRFVEGEEINE